jgi:hypothetical protein
MLIPVAVAVFGVAGCGAVPTESPAAKPPAPPADPAQFSAARFDANVRVLVELGARTPGSEALARARQWAQANAAATQADAAIVLVAPLATGRVDAAALAEESSGLAFVLEAARALAARGERVGVALPADEIAAAPPIAGAALAIYVRRACALPQRRDLLSHRVLRERFFRAANLPKVSFEQVEAPHAALLAAGARRVVALDAPAAAGSPCAPVAFGEALVKFVSDATALLARGRSNTAPLSASQGP